MAPLLSRRALVIVAVATVALASWAEALPAIPPRAEISALSETPLGVKTEMSSTSPGSRYSSSTSSTSTSSGGGSSTSSTTSYSSFSSSSSSSSSSGDVKGVRQRSDRVGIEITTPVASVVFNVGPTLENIGISVESSVPASPGSRGQDGPRGRVMIEDGAEITRLGQQYPALNLTMATPIFNFTYTLSSSGESRYGACFLGSDPGALRIVAPSRTFSGPFGPNADAEEILRTAEVVFAPRPLASVDHPPVGSLSLVTALPGSPSISLVTAKDLFSLEIPTDFQSIAPRCTSRTCDSNSCSLVF